MTHTQRWKADLASLVFYRRMGDNIRIARRELRLTHKDLSALVGLSCPVLSNIESGRQRISAHHLARFASALECTVADLYPKV